MSVRAQWGASALVVDESDPLQNMDIADIAKPIDLSRDSAEIFQELRESLSLESYLYRVPKITCDLKHGTPVTEPIPCPTCPHFRHYNVEDPLSRLCKVGREQAALVVELEAADAAERAAHESHAALDDELESALELAEVVLA